MDHCWAGPKREGNASGLRWKDRREGKPSRAGEKVGRRAKLKQGKKEGKKLLFIF
jgi:hypothetical protein